jgi:hypothetical protein
VNFASPYLASLSISSQPLVTVTKAAQATDAAVGTGAVSDSVTGTFTGFVASSIACLDFDLCIPTMKFEPDLDGRKATEFPSRLKTHWSTKARGKLSTQL